MTAPLADCEYWVMRVVAYQRGDEVWCWGDGKTVAAMALPAFIRSIKEKVAAEQWAIVGADVAEPVEVYATEEGARARMIDEQSRNPRERYLLVLSAPLPKAGPS